MRKALLLLAVSALFASPVLAEVYTVYSDQGFPPSQAPFNVAEFPIDPTAAFDPANSDFAVPEGTMSFKTTLNAGGTFAGWAFDFGATNAQDLSRFKSGELRFWVNSPTSNIKVEIQDPAQSDLLNINLQNGAAYTGTFAPNQWVLIRVPLAGASSLTSVRFPCVFTILTPGTFYIDDVRYVDASVPSPDFEVGLFNRSNNAPATQVTWTGASAATTWNLADQYIRLTVDPDTTTWGVQIYTDNTSAGANPQFTGDPLQLDPSGLVNVSTPSLRIPLAWSIVAVTSPTLTAADPNAESGDSFGWFFVKDRLTLGLGSTTAFSPGDPYVTVKNNYGIHFAQGPDFWYDPNQFAAANPPNIIYLEANFGAAFAQSQYQTNRLILEFFSL